MLVLGAPDGIARCQHDGSRYRLDLDHLAGAASLLGDRIPLDVLIAHALANALALPVPIIWRCLESGHTYRQEALPKRPGRYVPLCDVCRQACLERKKTGAGYLRYHAACRASVAYSTREKRADPYLVWVETGAA